MQIKEMLSDDNAVSPVIGVILMVAITVILAAVIASFVLGLGPGSTAPTADFDFNQEGNKLTITHATGDKLNPDNIYVRGDIGTDDSWNGHAATAISEIGSGNSIEVTLSDPSGSEVRIIWENADSSQTLESDTFSW